MIHSVQEAFCEAFPENITNVHIKAASGLYEVGIILSYPESDIIYQKDKIAFIMGDLTFGSYSPMNITQNKRHSQIFFYVRDITAYYVVSNLEDFARSIKNAAWERFNNQISLEIDRVINEDN